MLSNGFADLTSSYRLGFEPCSKRLHKRSIQTVVDFISESLSFMSTVGADKSNSLRSIDFFTSHEALLLEYEQSLTRLLKVPGTSDKQWYNTSGHFIWIGDRTRQVDGAHVEFFRGVQNPIGIKKLDQAR